MTGSKVSAALRVVALDLEVRIAEVNAHDVALVVANVHHALLVGAVRLSHCAELHGVALVSDGRLADVPVTLKSLLDAVAVLAPVVIVVVIVRLLRSISLGDDHGVVMLECLPTDVEADLPSERCVADTHDERLIDVLLSAQYLANVLPRADGLTDVA